MVRVPLRLFVLITALLTAGCADAPRFDQVSAQVPPVDGRARLFVYRTYDLSQSLQWVPVSVNGTGIGGVGPGHVVVCYLPPGTYTIDARSEGLWPDQAKTVAVAAGQDVYAEIGSFEGLDPTDESGAGMESTFVVMLEDTAAGRSAIAQLWYEPCQGLFAPKA
ncbi:MAG TPA: hypothetical protein VE397_01715 [Stellaceae bacterium]|nr:hypothetical protein [Stellaceae bacterium]